MRCWIVTPLVLSLITTPLLSVDIFPLQPTAQQLSSLKSVLSATVQSLSNSPIGLNSNNNNNLAKSSKLLKLVNGESDMLADSLLGDMLLTSGQVDTLINGFSGRKARRHRRQVDWLESLFRTWPVDKPIAYSYDDSLSPETIKAVQTALGWWEAETCVKFRRNDATVNRLKFTNGVGCSSYVGMLSGVTNLITLQSGYCGAANAAHEIAHSLGAIHEHQRLDRDKFISVSTAHLTQAVLYDLAMRYDFKKSYDETPYDYGSVMHYGSAIGRRMTSGHENDNVIITNDPAYQNTIGQRVAISFIDAKRINHLYCDKKCPQDLDCLNGGYTNPNNCRECKCPEGFGGRLCGRVQYTTAQCGGDLESSLEPTNLKSPNYPRPLPYHTDCYWILRAPQGHHVNLKFIRPFDMGDCAAVCQDNYVEVKRGPEFGPTGARICCPPAPHSNFTSTGDLMVVILKTSDKLNPTGFQAVFRTVKVSSSGTTNEILENFVRRKLTPTTSSTENTSRTTNAVKTTSKHTSKAKEKSSTTVTKVATTLPTTSTTKSPVTTTTEPTGNCDKKPTVAESIHCLEKKIDQLIKSNTRRRNRN